MNPLDKYGLRQDDFIVINSPICSTAHSFAHSLGSFEFEGRINELTSAYFNQWRFVLEAYEKMYQHFTDLNTKNDETTEQSIITDYDIKSIDLEIDFKNYSYLFIISLKSLLDIFAIITDIIQNRQIRKEHKLPDFFSYGERQKPENFIQEIDDEYKKLRVKQQKNWITKVKEIRDKVVHRGYLLKPLIGFRKTSDLTIQSYRGNNFYTGVDTINIGRLFDEFITQMPLIEKKISEIFIKEVSELKGGLSQESKFRYSELINEYSIKDLRTDSP